MKNLILIIGVMVTALSTQAQFTSAKLQAAGLTCAMCSNAINKSLQQLPFIESVQSEIKNSTFNITFSSTEEVNPDEIKRAVEDAGFSVAGLSLLSKFENKQVKKDDHLKIGNAHFHIVSAKDETLSGERQVTIIDRNFVTDKQFKKYNAAIKHSCFQTGKAAACCIKEGVPTDERVYHIVL